MTKFFITFTLVLCFNLLNAQEKNQITYIANEGVFIEYQGKKVLIDALHKSYKRFYQHTKPSYKNIMLNGDSPFEHIDLYLTTHIHKDHFDKELMRFFLENHNESILIAPQQVLDSLGKVPHIATQIYPLKGTDNGIMYEMDGIKVSSIPLIHSYPQKNDWVENMAYLLDFNGLSILHIGDAEFSPENINRIKKASKGKVDYAIIPDWFIQKTGNEWVQSFKAKKYIVVHVSSTKTGTYEGILKKRISDMNVSLNVFLRVGEFETIE